MKKLIFNLMFVLFCILGKGQISEFSATFEGGTTAADFGTELMQTKNGGEMYVVDNPKKDEVNSSEKVLKMLIPPGSSQRSEYHNSLRFITEGKTHFYKWKVFYPNDFMEGAKRRWLVVAQWKTWPCEEYGTGQMDYSEEICWNGGIFNDIELNHGNELDFRFRAHPDCGHLCYRFERNKWVEYVLEIYWTNESDGYYKLYANAVLIGEVTNVKTLFDNFPQDGKCDVRFGIGLYSNWSSIGAKTMSYYVDDLHVYYKDNGIELEDVCPDCVTKKKYDLDEIYSIVYKNNLKPFERNDNDIPSCYFSWNTDTTFQKYTFLNTKNYALKKMADDGCELLPEDSIFEEKSFNVKVYPNPTKKFLTLEMETLADELKIVDLKGRLRYAQRLTSLVEDIELNLPTGAYFVNVYEGNKKTSSNRIIIE